MIQLWVKADGCRLPPKMEDLPEKDPDDGTTVRRETYAAGEKGAEVVLYTIDGQGHNWAGRPVANEVTGPPTKEAEPQRLLHISAGAEGIDHSRRRCYHDPA